MYYFQEALEDLHSYMKKYGIKAFEWSADDDDIVKKENITCVNLHNIFYTSEDVTTDEEAAQKAVERVRRTAYITSSMSWAILFRPTSSSTDGRASAGASD